MEPGWGRGVRVLLPIMTITGPYRAPKEASGVIKVGILQAGVN